MNKNKFSQKSFELSMFYDRQNVRLLLSSLLLFLWAYLNIILPEYQQIHQLPGIPALAPSLWSYCGLLCLKTSDHVILVKSLRHGARLPGFKSWHYHLLCDLRQYIYIFFGRTLRHAELPRPGIKPTLPAVEGWSQPLDHQGSPILGKLINFFGPQFAHQ